MRKKRQASRFLFSKKNSERAFVVTCCVLLLLFSVCPTVLACLHETDYVRQAVFSLSARPVAWLSQRATAWQQALQAQQADAEQLLWLQQQIAELELRLSKSELTEAENKQLREQLQSLLKSLSATQEASDRYAWLDATLLELTEDQTLVLSRGSVDGVTVGTPIVQADGVVGIVTAVSENACTVTPVQHADFSMGVRIDNNLAIGVISGTVEQDGEVLGVLRYISYTPGTQSELAIGMRVLTETGGLVVGDIVSVGKDAYDGTIYAYIRYAADSAQGALWLIPIDRGEVTP